MVEERKEAPKGSLYVNRVPIVKWRAPSVEKYEIIKQIG